MICSKSRHSGCSGAQPTSIRARLKRVNLSVPHWRQNVRPVHPLGDPIMTELPSINALLMPIMMICICAMNLIWNGRRADGRTTLDAIRLQAALTEELYLLAKLYRTNLELLDRAEVRLLSTRIPMAIFRANVPRLTLLDEDTIRCLVSIHGNNEHVEMLVSEHAKSIKNGQCTVYIFEKDDPSIAQFRAMFAEGSQLIDHAIQTLEARRDASRATFTNAATLLGFAERRLDAAELVAPQARPAARHAAIEQVL
jgi:hypothetical protein